MEQQFGTFIRGAIDGKLRSCQKVEILPRDLRMVGQNQISSSHSVALIEVEPGQYRRQVVATSRIERIELKEVMKIL